MNFYHLQSAGLFQNGLLERNDVILIEPKQLDLEELANMDLEEILEKYSFVQKLVLKHSISIIRNNSLLNSNN